MSTIPVYLDPPDFFVAAIYADHVGFAGIPFRVRIVDGWSDWVAEPSIITRRIPGGNSSITQFMGLGPERVQYQLVLPSVADFAALRALVGTEGTLTLRDAAAAAAGETVVYAGVPYLELADVLLVSIDPGSVERQGSVIFCRATFQRDVPV